MWTPEGTTFAIYGKHVCSIVKAHGEAHRRESEGNSKLLRHNMELSFYSCRWKKAARSEVNIKPDVHGVKVLSDARPSDLLSLSQHYLFHIICIAFFVIVIFELLILTTIIVITVGFSPIIILTRSLIDRRVSNTLLYLSQL
jgi:hypothetical protein